MLVLSRKLNETIVIGGDIRVTIFGIENDRVRIGIDAPPDVKVFRSELVEEIKDVNQESVANIANFEKIKKQLY